MGLDAAVGQAGDGRSVRREREYRLARSSSPKHSSARRLRVEASRRGCAEPGRSRLGGHRESWFTTGCSTPATRLREARPRSSATLSPSACSACRRSPRGSGDRRRTSRSARTRAAVVRRALRPDCGTGVRPNRSARPRGWQALADVGVLGALGPADLGGLELDLTTVAALIEECGYGIAAGPLVWSCFAATVLAGWPVAIESSRRDPRGRPILVEHGTPPTLSSSSATGSTLHPTASLRLRRSRASTR